MNSPEPDREFTAFVPMLLITLLLIGILGVQLNERVAQQKLLEELIAGQAEPLEESRRMREQFQGLVAGTAQLAAAGNDAARRIQSDLERAGVRFTPDAAN
jgi:hypothetical protein